MFISSEELVDIQKRLGKLEEAAFTHVRTGETGHGMFGPYKKTKAVSAIELLQQLADALGYELTHKLAATTYQKKAKAKA